MPTDGREPNDYRLRNTPMVELLRGRSRAAEGFGVPLKPEGQTRGERALGFVSPNWEIGVVLCLIWFLGLGVVALVAFAVAPPHPIEPKALFTGLSFAGFTIGFFLVVALGTVGELLARRGRRAASRAHLWRLAVNSKESGPRRDP